MKFRSIVALFVLLFASTQQRDTLAPLQDEQTPKNFKQMWTSFDPRAEPLEVETLQAWEEDDVVLRTGGS